ncbi:uncharacterized protein LOC129294154 isoform X3 [Prosopis cineraria]|uniref:uncharacterized protein LOC129294154 isoform X3 n=1 Tax=Prosopis cineraria TaxID=364024 RepID=UPI00240EF30C|nr:uncharacterized protein LOC129294154 isoform X3 [Prosopis cineraria]
MAMLNIVQEIAIYIDRFHNLDLFQQGWYQMKITMRWEDSEYVSVGTPARIVQYEASDIGSSSIYGAWRIDDIDNSFSTRPFQIKYARQDIHLCTMITFRFLLDRFEGLPTTAVIMKFELMYAPTVQNGSNLQAFLDASSCAIHEFRLPPKSLSGLHSYCPVYFDALHYVLVDITVHVSILRATSYHSALKELDDVVDVKDVIRTKALLTAHDILLEELLKLSKAIDLTIDISELVSKGNNVEFLNYVPRASQVASNVEVSVQGKPQNGLEGLNGALDFQNVEKLHSFSKSEMLDCFNSLGDQMLYLWNNFLKFHRDNKTKVLDFLRDAWAEDRKAEWSIWMLHSKVEMPHHYIKCESHGSSTKPKHRRVSSSLKVSDEPPQTAATRAELHRRSITQMRINNRSIQDMQVFGDPSRMPIVVVERVMNAPRRTISDNSYMKHIELMESHSLQTQFNSATVDNQLMSKVDAFTLKIVVFVHGFQGHHLDLQLVRNQWLLIDPNIEFLMSEANEDKTSGDLREMGQRLAQEVISFLKRRMDKASRSGHLGDIRISFVGHSIGNLIIRTTIADSIMEPYLGYLHTYVSLSGPHLGYLYNSSSTFNSGLWLLKRLTDIRCIHQLTFTDDPDIQKTFLYNLCKLKTLYHFKHIILVSSPQDGYVPYHSARIESCQAAVHDTSKRGRVFLEMLNNLLDQIRANSSQHRVFMRCDVNFDTAAFGKNFDSFIGRAAHVEFLESDIYARFIMWSFPQFFR